MFHNHGVLFHIFHNGIQVAHHIFLGFCDIFILIKLITSSNDLNSVLAQKSQIIHSGNMSHDNNGLKFH